MSENFHIFHPPCLDAFPNDIINNLFMPADQMKLTFLQVEYFEINPLLDRAGQDLGRAKAARSAIEFKASLAKIAPKATGQLYDLYLSKFNHWGPLHVNNI